MWRNKLTVEGVNFTLTAAGLRFLAKTVTHTWLSVWYQSCLIDAGFSSWTPLFRLTGISPGFWILASLSSVHAIHWRMAASLPEMMDKLSILFGYCNWIKRVYLQIVDWHWMPHELLCTAPGETKQCPIWDELPGPKGSVRQLFEQHSSIQHAFPAAAGCGHDK